MTALQVTFEDPVVAADGVVYERYAITDWLNKCDRGPLHNVPLAHKRLLPAHEKKQQVDKLLAQQAEAIVDEALC